MKPFQAKTLDQKKRFQVNFPLTNSERDAFLKLAKKHNLTRAALARQMVLHCLEKQQ